MIILTKLSNLFGQKNYFTRQNDRSRASVPYAVLLLLFVFYLPTLSLCDNFQIKILYFSVDATVESGYLCRLVNHGYKHERNAVMKEVNGHLCLFTSR